LLSLGANPNYTNEKPNSLAMADAGHSSALVKPHKRFPWLWYLLALFVIAAFAFAPIGSVMLCGAIANAYGCKVDEGSAHPCIINGHDYGELLYSLGVMGWFMLVTIPGGLVAFASWLIFFILHRVAWRKRISAGIPPPIPPPPATA
jgi:hypothetical protein